jgi:hypothetical protein
VYEDKSYDWTLKGPPSSWYIKQATGLARGADRAGHESVGAISLKHLYEIAKVSRLVREPACEPACVYADASAAGCVAAVAAQAVSILGQPA